MNFDEWDEKLIGPSTAQLVKADWKAERDFYLPQNKELEEVNNSMGPKMFKLIDALVNIEILSGYDTYRDPKHWIEMINQSACVVLAEVKVGNNPAVGG